jgi:hypothetical protein
MVLGLFLTQKSNELLMQKSVCITEAEVRVFLTNTEVSNYMHIAFLTSYAEIKVNGVIVRVIS